MLKYALNDPIVEILVKNSNITQIQFQTFLIDLFHRQNNGEYPLNEPINNYRLDKKITRGAFNRIRSQAINNIIRSIYTIFLLGYFGILETPQLEPYIDASNRLKSYVEKNDGSGETSLLTELLTEDFQNLILGKDFYQR